MKEFIKSNTVTYNLMSFTGFKSLMLFSLLLEAPKSYAEICEFFKNHEYIKEEISIDTLRVYLTSLKRSGCEIIRTKKDEGGKYKLVSHPFELKISDQQLKSIVKIYRIILKTIDISGLLAFEKFLRNLAEKIKNEKLMETIKKVSVLKNIDLQMLEDLIKYSKEQMRLTLLYNSPRSGIKDVHIIADKVAVTQNKVYIYGTSLDYNQESYYLVQRIVKVLDVQPKNPGDLDIKKITVGYELTSLNPNTKLSEDEKIVDINENSIIVEVETSNMFMMKRKILEYGSMCRVLYPDSFREEIINTLQKMREGYLDE